MKGLSINDPQERVRIFINGGGIEEQIDEK